MIFITIFCYGLLGAYELIPLYKQKQYRDLLLNSFLSVCSLFIAALLTFGITIPSPQEPIKQIVLLLLKK